jgi:hypothetical protein
MISVTHTGTTARIETNDQDVMEFLGELEEKGQFSLIGVEAIHPDVGHWEIHADEVDEDALRM